MAEHGPPEQTGPPKLAQTTVRHERGYPDDRVVAPVCGFPQLDGCQPGTVEPAITTVGKLLQTGKPGFCPGQAGCGLDNPSLGPGFHELYQPGNAIGTEQTVGIQNHHIAVAAPPSTQEIGDIAALVVQVDVAPPVEQVLVRTQLPAYLLAGCLLLQPDVWVPTVREHVEIHGPGLPLLLKILDDSFQTTESMLHRFMADGHHDGGWGRERLRGPTGPCTAGEAPGVATETKGNESESRRPETHANPGKQHPEYQQQYGDRSGTGLIRDSLGKQKHTGQSLSGYKEDKQEAPPEGNRAPGARIIHGDTRYWPGLWVADDDPHAARAGQTTGAFAPVIARYSRPGSQPRAPATCCATAPGFPGRYRGLQHAGTAMLDQTVRLMYPQGSPGCRVTPKHTATALSSDHWLTDR